MFAAEATGRGSLQLGACAASALGPMCEGFWARLPRASMKDGLESIAMLSWQCCGSQATAWHPCLAPTTTELSQPCAFCHLPQGTELLELLEERGCDTLVVGGVMTNLCCETTARCATRAGRPGRHKFFVLYNGKAPGAFDMQGRSLGRASTAPCRCSGRRCSRPAPPAPPPRRRFSPLLPERPHCALRRRCTRKGVAA